MSKGNWCIENDFAAQRELAYYTEEKLGKLCRISELEKQFIELQDRYNALREAVANTLIIYDRMAPSFKDHIAARAEVDRLLGVS